MSSIAKRILTVAPAYSGAAPVSPDADAQAYIDQLVVDGASPTTTQQDALHAFFNDGKANGWYAKLEHLWFPIWEAETPNRRDAIALAQAQVGGTLTHATGYLQGDASTGYFASHINLDAMGLSATDYGFGALIPEASVSVSSQFVAAQFSNGGAVLNEINTGTTVVNARQDAAQIPNQSLLRENQAGIFTLSLTGGAQRLRLHRTAGLAVNVSETDTATGALGNTPLGWCARAAFFSYNTFNDFKYGAMFITDGMTEAEDLSFAAALKTLWETSTGLTLP